MLRRFFAIFLVVPLLIAVPALAQEDASVIKSHGISRFGDLKYPADFTHFDYVNPDAPKGGELRMSAPGTFDSLNPFIVKGTPAAAGGLIYDTLLASSLDEPTSMYGLVAESIEYPEDKSWVIFDLRPEARFHDGEPITAEDVVFSFHTLVEKGAPLYRFYYANIIKAEALGPHQVKFTFNQKDNAELPAIIGQLPVLPKHYWEGRDFAATTLTPPPGSGPYKIGAVQPGRSITYERVADYWGKDLAVNKGRNNFDRVTYEYYRDGGVTFEAFKAGRFDLRPENISRNWATAYDFKAVQDGAVVKVILKDETPEPAQAYVFNLRRAKFQDPRVRQAIGLAFDFDWLNENLFYNFYKRTASYWPGSELAATGLPSEAELKLLEPYRDQVPPEVFTREFTQPTTRPPGSLRDNLREAARLLDEAGWQVQNGVRTNVKTGEKLTIEFVSNQADLERVINPYIRNLERIGIRMHFRVVDASQMQDILNNYDFDMTSNIFQQSISPGNEQREFWGSMSADQPGGRNVIGIKNPVVDALIEKIIFAPSRADVVAATRALDRVLLWNHYAVLNYYSGGTPVAMWNKFSRPATEPRYGADLYSWWVDPAKVAKLRAAGYAAK